MELEDCRIDYLPTASEITEKCAQIRSRWTVNEKRRRYVGALAPEERRQAWRPPVIDTSHFRLTACNTNETV